ncbi:MAG TPA: ROK family protein [Blastocatellia bacterium]|nr:ROK family protein [Blastocatellia bacterium]
MKPTVRSQISPQLVIGIEIDPDRLSTALVDGHGKIIAERQSEPARLTTRSVAATVAGSILDLAASRERGSSSIGAVGISVAGLIDPVTDRVSIPAWKNWVRVDLRQLIEDELSKSGHDIGTPLNEKRARAQHKVSPHPAMIIHNRQSCAAVAESWNGAARGKDHVVYLSLGAEVEVGIWSQGQVLRGSNGLAGSAGWLALSEGFRQEYGDRGCLAVEAASGSVTRRAIEGWNGNSHSILSKLIKSDPAQLEPATIVRAARGGDPLALRVVNETCQWIGRAIANLVSILNPEAVVIGGELGRTLRPFLVGIREETGRWLPPQISKSCRIVNATITEDAGLIGAARLAWLKSSPPAA